MTKRRQDTALEDSGGAYCKVPIGDNAINGHALIDSTDAVWLKRFCGNQLAFFLSNGYVNVKWKGLKRSVARLLLNARDNQRVVYGSKGRLNLRRSNISLSTIPHSATHFSSKTTERNKLRKTKRVRVHYVEPVSLGEALDMRLTISKKAPR